ncbi:MAG: ATP phosphoribosyltransferase regulatory subunit [Patescibacteria group bacterium]|nr:ATP phosphoribosyltransferase regulatory subunit [Patescibacteria group bacterium]
MGRHKKTQTDGAYTPKKIPALEGAADVITDSDPLWEAVLKRLANIGKTYGFAKVEPPLLEDQYLYQSFYRQNQLPPEVLAVSGPARPAALRPAMLPGVLRGYYQNKIFDKLPLAKWHYGGWTYRVDKKGLLTSNFEYGLEIFGGFTHLAEAQLIGAVWELLGSLGLKDVALEVNNIGEQACQQAYQDSLRDFLRGKKYDLCDNCNESLQTRPLNVFRCANLDCQSLLAEAPAILDFLSEASHKQFTSMLEALDEMGIPYQLNPVYAGVEGCAKTNFVFKYKTKDETYILGEGGSHEGYIQTLCGKPHSCFGFVGSASLLRQLLEQNKVSVSKELHSDVFLVPLGELASKKSLRLFRDLTTQRIAVHDHFGQSGVKNQLKAAQTQSAPIALIMGQKEAMEEMVILRDVKSGMQEVISYDKIVDEVKKRLGK